MATRIFTRDDLPEAAAALRRGALVAFPTETVYGLGADATNEQAVRQVFAAKGRPADNPLIVTVADIAMVARFAPLPQVAQQVMAAFWPGPLTIILTITPGSLSPVVTGGLKTAAFRLPQNALTRALIQAAGVPLVGPSANLSGKPSPTTAGHVLHDFDGVIAGVLDDGPTAVGVESTVLDLTVAPPAILRPGAIDPDALRPLLGSVTSEQQVLGAKEVPKAPGMKYKHYAPNAQVVVTAPEQFPAALAWAKHSGQPFGVMATDAMLAEVPAGVLTYSLGRDVQTATHALFAGLRWFDQHPAVTVVLAESFPLAGLGAAYMNRLLKAAGDTRFGE